MEREELEKQKMRADADSLLLKIVVWTIIIAVAGAVVCIVLAAVRWALEACLIIAGLLVIIALAGMVVYNRVKYRIKEREYNRQQNQQNM